VADRTHAADDRVAASTDRAISARERATSSIDSLTGAHRRDPGMVELGREVARAQRTGTPLVLVFVDVDGLKRTNDSLGHAAGDKLLHRVVRTVRSHCRPYDLIIRYGGDEFLCALLDATLATADERFSLIGADLAAEPPASISIGLAELAASDEPDGLVARADAEMRAGRRRRAGPDR
jgi:two-component system cell cycle response regulator